MVNVVDIFISYEAAESSIINNTVEPEGFIGTKIIIIMAILV